MKALKGVAAFGGMALGAMLILDPGHIPPIFIGMAGFVIFIDSVNALSDLLRK